MKISEVTVKQVADFFKLEDGEYTDTYIQSLIDISKAFIRSYTGIKDRTITSESVGVGDDNRKIFRLEYSPVVPLTEKIYLDGVLKTLNTDYTISNEIGDIKFLVAPNLGSIITADYITGIDAFEEFIHVLYILCQDMFYNRTMYVDSNNINKVYQSILDMHCVNLL